MSHVHPTRDDAVLGALSEVVGGPVGEHAGRARWGTPLAVLLAVTALVFALGMTSKSFCADREWNIGNEQFSHLCYSDVPYAYTDTGLDQQAWPWSGDAQVRARFATTTQPALVGLWQYATARITYELAGRPDLGPRYRQDSTSLADDPGVLHERVLFTAVNAVGLGLLAMLATAALSLAGRRRPWDAAGFAAAPVLLTTGIVSFDLLAVAAVAGALFTWSRGRPVATGLLLGLATAAGVWPVLVLGALALTAGRRGGRRASSDDVLPLGVAALAAWVLANAPAFVSGRAQWEVFWRTAVHRGPDAGSLWTVLERTVGLDDDLARVGAFALLALWVLGVVALTLRAPLTPRPTQVAFLLVAGVLVLGVAYRPEQVLWLLPLAALARPRWRDLLVWQAGEVLYFAMVWWWLGGELAAGDGGQAGFYLLAIAIRILCTLYLVGVVVRDVLLAWHDPAVAPRQETLIASNVVVV